MTASQLRAAGSRVFDGLQRNPVIVVTYAHSGASLLQRLLSGSAGLTCTSGTGLLPLCELATSTWREVENRDGPLSTLAVTSIRAMVGAIITGILAGTGGSRLCEISFAPASSALTFLELFPAAKLLCLHRSCPDVIDAGVKANPWGLADSPFWPYAAAHPGRSAAAIAAYWASRTEPLLRLEEAHPGACRRVRYEDLVGNPGRVVGEIIDFMGLGQQDPVSAHRASDGTPAAEEAAAHNSSSQVPVSQIPPALRARVSELLTRVGYPPMA
jgi:hypothetical protein